MTAELDPLSVAIGEIKAKLDLVLKTQGEDREAAASYRTEVRGELRGIHTDVSKLKAHANSNADELAEMRPHVEDWRTTKAQWEGASKLTKIIWAVLTALGLGGVLAIAQLLRAKS